VIIGTPLSFVDLEELEDRLYSNPFIRSAEVFRDMKGYIIADVTLKKPVARILNQKGPDAYVSSEGEVFPTSKNFTARVLLLDGTGTQKFIESGFESKGDLELLDMIEFINSDPLWSKQITQISIDSNHKLKMWPQVSKQIIEFGEVWNYQKKLRKLEIFYRKILPAKGWNTYSKVNLEFEDQIVAD
jgi:cell division protein FtsQ